MCEVNLGFADRFSENSFTLIEKKVQTQPVNPFFLEPEPVPEVNRFNLLKDMLFEKIVTVPCWFEYDSKTQYDLIIKFLHSKNIKTPVLRFLPGRHFKKTLSQQHRAWKCLS